LFVWLIKENYQFYRPFTDPKVLKRSVLQTRVCKYRVQTQLGNLSIQFSKNSGNLAFDEAICSLIFFFAFLQTLRFIGDAENKAWASLSWGDLVESDMGGSTMMSGIISKPLLNNKFINCSGVVLKVC
jgi:hypothetical protein